MDAQNPKPEEPQKSLAGDLWAAISNQRTLATLFIISLAAALFFRFAPANIIPPVVQDSFAFPVGLILLVLGADYLVHGGARLAKRLGLSPFFIGVTVIAFGTSAPELAASIRATLDQNGGIAIGNVLGSNIANVCLILGVTALVRPIITDPSIVKTDVPIMIAIAILAPIAMLDTWFGADSAQISRIDGGILFALLIAYVFYNWKVGKIDPEELEHELEGDHNDEKVHQAAMSVPHNLLLVAAGLAGLILGAETLVDSAVNIASRIGVPQVVIGLTLVAFGTSVPELALSVRAALHRHPEIAIGNIIGSNVFNLLCVLGIAGLVDPIKVPTEAITRDIWAMVAITILTYPLMRSRYSISRPEGALLLVIYFGYAIFVFFASNNAAAP